MLARGDIERLKKTRQTGMLIKRSREEPAQSAHTWRKKESRAITIDRNSSQDDNKKTLFVVLVRRDNKRRAQAQKTGILPERIKIFTVCRASTR